MAYTIEVSQKLYEAARQTGLGATRGAKKEMSTENIIALTLAESVLAAWKSTVYNKAEKLAEFKFEAAKEAHQYVSDEPFTLTKAEFVAKNMAAANELLAELELIVKMAK